jgi:hypothetical protein
MRFLLVRRADKVIAGPFTLRPGKSWQLPATRYSRRRCGRSLMAERSHPRLRRGFDPSRPLHGPVAEWQRDGRGTVYQSWFDSRLGLQSPRLSLAGIAQRRFERRPRRRAAMTSNFPLLLHDLSTCCTPVSGRFVPCVDGSRDRPEG